MQHIMKKTSVGLFGLLLGVGAIGCTSDMVDSEGNVKASVTGGSSTDFDIQKFGVKTDKGEIVPYLKVAGRAGNTIPDEPNEIFAYVFVTDAGIFAVASHEFIDDDEQTPPPPAPEWHGHKVTLDANNCITSITEQGSASLDNKHVSVTGTGATSVSTVLTARLVAANGQVCVTDVFDSQSL
jgi:hypothetical protein